MVMENEEMILEKSWKNIVKSVGTRLFNAHTAK